MSIMTLFIQYNETNAKLNEVKASIRAQFAELSMRDRLRLALAEGCELDDILKYESDYTGVNGSLYDDFHWERCETRTLSDIVETVCDRAEDFDYDTPNDEIADILLARKGCDHADVLIDMLRRGIGRARHDW